MEGKAMTEAPEIIRELVERFERNIEHYKDSSYKEEQLKQEFLNPFFKSLGWDVDNKSGAAPQYRDVIFEDSIKVAGGTTAPDYCFTLSGRKMFFLEAKKPSVNIKRDIHPAYQLRRYAWSAKLPVSILSDFEEFAVYESRKLPKKDDKASTERIMYLTYKDYVDKWEEISSVFSKTAVLQGSFDRFIKSTRKKRGTQEVDDEFLKEMERWRLMLARNFALRNDWLSSRLLNYAVQLTIDRMLFLRICEDRGIEKYKQLHSLLDKENIYRELCKTYVKADEKYNSGLFHFKKEKGRGTLPDDLTLRLTLDDKVLKDLIKHLYYPDCPYEFSVLPPEILGNVYEQFLGKVIRLTPGHRAKVEDKPEVKKAGGVYYTPKYIVDYIVENTVGKMCKGKTPDQISKLRILDPACGSGSFLLGAYTYLLKYHEEYYSNLQNKKRLKDKIYPGRSGEWQLDIKEKKRILLNNIYGVDIDSQAVEVTKLSLLLKVLEGESRQLTLIQERALPDLGNNIKCGNSLIGPDFYSTGVQTTLFDEVERYHINAFDWNTEFREIMNNGGFNSVIGNPPYLRIQGLQEYYGSQINYFMENYQSAVKRFDLYLLFAEKGFDLLSKDGYLGFICPHKFLNSDFGSGLREYFIDKVAINSFISFGNNLIFNKASTYTGILLLKKTKNNFFTYYEFPNTPIIELTKKLQYLSAKDMASYDLSDFTSNPWLLTSSTVRKILTKIQQHVTLGEVFDKIFQGVVTGNDDIYFLKKLSDDKNDDVEVYSQHENKIIKLEKEILKPMLKGEDVTRYSELDNKYYCIYPYKLIGEKTVIIEENELRNNFPLAYKYLVQYKKKLINLRIKYKTNPKYWYSCHRGRSIIDFQKKQIITSEISLGCNMTIDTNRLYHNTTVYSLIPNPKMPENTLYWLGLLNSKVMWWFLINTGNVLRGGYFRFKTNYLKPFPICTIDFSDPVDKARHDKMVSLVEQMLDLHKKLAKATIPHEKQMIQRRIDATDNQIDTLVYELYGLTEEEIRIVEEAVK